MKKINGLYKPNTTDIKKAEAHTRASARKQNGNYDGNIDCYFNKVKGAFCYEEFVGNGYLETNDNFIFVYSYPVRSWS